MGYRVRNANNTTGMRPVGSSHLEDSIIHSDQCAANGCSKPATVGAHVYQNGVLMLVPFCHYHNNQFGKDVTVDGRRRLTPASGNDYYCRANHDGVPCAHPRQPGNYGFCRYCRK
jgi:hypothetical protein